MTKDSAPSEKSRNTPNTEDGQEKVEPKKAREIKVEEENRVKERLDKEKKQEDKKFQEELKKKKKELAELKAKGDLPSVKLDDVSGEVVAINDVQDEIDIEITSIDRDEYDRFLIEAGKFSPKVVGDMSNAQVLAAVQTVLGEVEVELPKDVEPETKLRVAKARNSDNREESIAENLDKASKYVHGDDNPARELYTHKVKLENPKKGTSIERDVVVYTRGNNTYTLGGMQPNFYDSKTVRALLRGSGIDIHASMPKGWDDWSLGEKKSYLAEKYSIVEPVNEITNILITGMPVSGTLGANPALQAFVGEVERASDVRGEGELLSRLGEIEKELSRAVIEGRLDGANAQVREVRDKLNAYLDVEIPAYQARVRREQQIEHGQIDFNEHFVGDYKRVRDFIDTGDSASLLGLMGDAKAEVEKIRVLTAAEIVDDSSWPGDIDVRKVFEVTRALTQEEGLIGRGVLQTIISTDPANVRLLTEFLTPDRDVNLLRRLNSFYQNIYANLSDARKRAIAGDIEDNAQLATGSISQGWREFNPRMKELYDVFDRKKLPGAVGALREWRGLTLISGVEENVLYAQLTQPPAHWEDTPVAINKLISAIEPSGLSVQDLQPTLGAAFAMLNRIDQSTSFGRGMYIELKEQIEAFKFKHSLIITAHTKTMDPEALGQVFLNDMEGTAEVTFQAMISRFARDAKGRRFYTEREAVDGPLLAAEKEVNLFDVGKRLYSERLRDERIKMNMVEEMTRYSIENPFDAETMKSIKKRVGYEYLSDDWKAMWEGELEAIRQWLAARIVSKGGSVDDWGKETDLRHGITKAVVSDWYERTTLHGAYGVLGQEDLNEAVAQLVGVFRADGGTDAEVEARIRKMLGEGPTWIAVRRTEMRQRIKNELKAMGLSYDTSVHYGRHGEHDKLIKLGQQGLDELMESGYIGALEANVYELTWIFEWSTYEFIHIYGKGKSKFDDDYKALVQTRSTDGYWAKVVDHNWEYMHEDFEDRGRGRSEDVNQIFMQHFPGKHHWLFGHVSMATRFIGNFLDDRGNALVEARTQKLVDEYDFHNKKYEDSFRDYMKGVAVRELIVAGAISFADKKYSDVVKNRGTFNKFNPVDNSDDRKRLKEFVGFGGLQAFLADPEGDKYMELTTKDKIFPSTRDPRLFPWQEFGLRGFWDIAHKYKYKLFGEVDLSNGKMENFVDRLVGLGSVEREQGERFKRTELGMGPGILGRGFFRGLRALWEEKDEKTQIEGGRRGWIFFIFFVLWGPLKEFFKSAFAESKKQ